MSKTRNNHYVPQWYQQGFFEPNSNTLELLDLAPPQRALTDGRTIVERAQFTAPTSRCFVQRDLYSTFFGSAIDDEIERKLFGAFDAKGAKAIRAFCGTDVGEWHRNFEALFEFIDIQKLRTPKGLDWLKRQYPELSQNELMYEMQGIRRLNCTIWTEAVREIVSAEAAGIKFLVSDHPVTVYNHAVTLDDRGCKYPDDPSIALKASQTIFPLSRDFCLILTNLEYAKDPSSKPTEKRTFPRAFRQSLVRTDAFIRTRFLSDIEVAQVNFVLKARARRYVAAGRMEWLYPERLVTEPWDRIRDVLLPTDELYRFGGEIYAGYDDGRTHYQDAFGRTEKQRDFLLKPVPKRKLRAGDSCGCGSGKRFDTCCMTRPEALRPTWRERSIRERNLFLSSAIARILRLDEGKDWTAIRGDLTDDQISEVYHIYEALWPLETDLLQLLPKPDGRSRAVYTGSIHPQAMFEFAHAAPLYFGELIVETPFVHNGVVADEFKPVEHPKIYRHEFLKAVLLFMTVMPLVERGLINLIPDPCDFDYHLRRQMMAMAENRAPWLTGLADKEVRAQALVHEDMKRSLMCLPRDALRAQMREAMPELDSAGLEEALDAIEGLREGDPLAVLQVDSLMGGEEGGQFHHMRLAPNFEMTMYLAQATGASIVTDSPVRWAELQRSIRPRGATLAAGLPDLGRLISDAAFRFPADGSAIAALSGDKGIAGYSALMRDTFKYMHVSRTRGARPNVEASLAARFTRLHAPAQAALAALPGPYTQGRITPAFPTGGIQDNSINRLLLMSSSDHHIANVPMAFFLERAGT